MNEEWTYISLPVITLESDFRYLDLRIDNGSIDIDKFIITPAH